MNPQEIDFCAEYDVRQTITSFKAICNKRHRAGIKCHSKREDCPDWKPSIALSLEEVRAKYGLGGNDNGIE